MISNSQRAFPIGLLRRNRGNVVSEICTDRAHLLRLATLAAGQVYVVPSAGGNLYLLRTTTKAVYVKPDTFNDARNVGWLQDVNGAWVATDYARQSLHELERSTSCPKCGAGIAHFDSESCERDSKLAPVVYCSVRCTEAAAVPDYLEDDE